jgi:hypothetical protein
MDTQVIVRVVSVAKKGGIAVVTINRPPVNALSAFVRKGLLDAFTALATILKWRPSCSRVRGGPSSPGPTSPSSAPMPSTRSMPTKCTLP